MTIFKSISGSFKYIFETFAAFILAFTLDVAVGGYDGENPV